MKRTLWFLTIIALLFLVILTYVVVVIYLPRQQVRAAEELGFQMATPPTELHPAQNSARFLTLVGVMIAGIICSYIFEVAKQAGPTVNLPRELGKMFSSSRLIMALVVSPIVFNSIYLIIGTNPQSLGDYLLAFQNGFFWEAVLSGFSRDRY